MVTPILSRVPPPPILAVNDPALNKWLIDLTSFINSGGGSINPALIPGYDALIAEVNLQAIEIASLTNNVAANTSAIGILNSAMASLAVQVNALTNRSVVLNGTGVPGAGLGRDGDWYAKTSAATHVYVKVAGAWVVIV